MPFVAHVGVTAADHHKQYIAASNVVSPMVVFPPCFGRASCWCNDCTSMIHLFNKMNVLVLKAQE